MPSRIEDYALIGDCHTAALVARDGSLDWMCVPRFDSDACFAALLGTPDNGRWLIAPAGEVRSVRRAYRDATLVLDTTFTTDEGVVTLTDCMLPFGDGSEVLRIVYGKRGRVRMRTEIVVRFDYGSVVPWVRREGRGLMAIAGPDMLHLHTEVPLKGENFKTAGEFTVTEGERVPFLLTWHPSNVEPPIDPDPYEALARTEDWWQKWAGGCCHAGEYHDAVLRSLITLKALTYAPTGGIVAAPTTSLPEQVGGVRNWDYRYCWVRDATFTLLALLNAGFKDEARAWREWLLRAVAGKPADLQIMYSITGQRRLTELELAWLPGYENSRPVRIGNAAHGQFQLDVYGELFDVLYQCRRAGLGSMPAGWEVGRAILDFLESAWQKPDEGIWEVRGPRRDFTHSKVMAWVAFDRAMKAAERFGREGPVDHWRATRDAIHREVCERGYDPKKNAFVQYYYGGSDLDASLLMIPLVGFLPPNDPRVRGTVEAVERELLHDGFVQRYPNRQAIDGLPPGEGAFLPCTFWLADNLVLIGRHDDARRLFERLLGLCNDVGLLSEEYDPGTKRLLGNFPQAFSHIGLVNTAHNLTQEGGPATHRGTT